MFEGRYYQHIYLNFNINYIFENMKNIYTVSRFVLNEYFANTENSIGYNVVDDNLFIHGFESKSGKSLSSFFDVVTVLADPGNGQIIDITSQIQKQHTNKLSIKQLFTNSGNISFIKLTITCGNLHTKKCTSIIIGTK